MSDTILEVRNLKQYFSAERGRVVKAVDGVSFKIDRGETFGLVGESGSGKSTIGRTIIRLYDPTSGEIFFNGSDISGKLNSEEKDKLSQNMQMIFQDSTASLNPRKKIIDIVAQGLDVHHLYSSKNERKEKVIRILEKVGLSEEHLDRYPHQFSGGQRQRIGIARALILNPDLIIADEAISALDISIQAQVINMMKDLQEQLGTTYLFIAHDLAMVKHISDYIGVLHMGHLVEMGTKDDIFNNPLHPYTHSLLSAIPSPDPIKERSRNASKYDYTTSGIDYNKGTEHYIDDTHMVLATDDELHNWMDWR
jgi:oligopeptide transport system ATP-binding protein